MIDFTPEEFAFLASELRKASDHEPALRALLSNNYNVILAALDKASLPPQSPLGETGWKMVPVEPTEAMKRAGFDPFIAAHDPFFNQNEPTAPIYRAMLAAAPAAPIDQPGADRAGLDADLRATLTEMGRVADDPMWADHVELPKGRLRLWIKSVRAAIRSLFPKESP